jgi:RND family efflux transporter MFP subunit
LLVLALIGAALWAGVAFSDSIRRATAALQTQLATAFRDTEPSNTTPKTEGQLYQGPMHPWIVQTEPGTCPICGMDLVPVAPEKFTGELTIDPRVVQNMGVRVDQVVEGPLTRTIRTVGTVDYDETQVRDVNIKVKGWIEGLHVDSTGAHVAKGAPLFDIYSPELYAAQEELLLAHQSPSLTQGSPTAQGSTESDSLLGAARTRLMYYDITTDQIEALLERDIPTKRMTIRSPHAGTVIDKHANDGMRVTPGMRVYRIADLSRIWVMATIYEYQLPYVHEGQAVTMTLPYLPGATFQGEVDYVYPYMNNNTREVKIRLAFENPDRQLKPGMFANVKLRDTIKNNAVLAPREAVLDTGERQVALVSTGGGTFEPRDLKLGPTTGDNQVQVLQGLKPGEKVVTSGQFLIDSEAKMRASLARMVEGQKPAATQQAQTPDSPELSQLPESANKPLADAIDAYLTIVEQLANDRFDARSAATRLDDSLSDFHHVMASMHAEQPNRTAQPIQRARQAAQQLVQTEKIEVARKATATLSRALTELLKLTGTSPATKTPLVYFHCPMYQEEQGGTPWLQPAGEPRNPYYGSDMLACYDTKQALPEQADE